MFSRLPGFEVKRSGILDVSVTDLLVCAVARLCCTRGSTELRSPDACVVLSVDVGSFWSLISSWCILCWLPGVWTSAGCAGCAERGVYLLVFSSCCWVLAFDREGSWVQSQVSVHERIVSGMLMCGVSMCVAGCVVFFALCWLVCAMPGWGVLGWCAHGYQYHLHVSCSLYTLSYIHVSLVCRVDWLACSDYLLPEGCEEHK